MAQTELTDRPLEAGINNAMMLGIFSIMLVGVIHVFQNVSSRNLALEIYSPHFTSGKSESQPLDAVLDLSGLAGRALIEIWVKSSGAAVFYIEGSIDGVNFRNLGTLTVPSGGGENHEGFMNAYPVIRVRTEATNDNEIEIAATR